MARFGLSDVQADAILDIKLRQLAKLEENRAKRRASQTRSRASRYRRTACQS